jgi:hypothetical protein
VALDVQSLLAGLTIASGIFLAGRFLGKLEEKLELKNGNEYDCEQQLKSLHIKLDRHLHGKAFAGSFAESRDGENGEGEA